MKLHYTATATFNPTTHRTSSGYEMDWPGYLNFTGFHHVREIVTLDGMLGQSVVDVDYAAESDALVWGTSLAVPCYRDLRYLLDKLTGLDPASYNVLAVLREPEQPVNDVSLVRFSFLGYDLMDRNGGVSALTNCGKFSDAFSPEAVNEWGLLPTHAEARRIGQTLRTNDPGNPHADCLIWAIWRRNQRVEFIPK